ncbi:type I methionyl aminopeptidase [Xinfangfangia sp. D13-10-4-6]|uniref:type I methionyl aminopeptidase n=1 Tax=Pseudogemmobacter hezensis TaxID=2737662 RepID=UPI001557E95D|nr:type I methionyl aminopeptidase [Pseudogemmobacter hezensis]NPD15000.1 type I methionyl aminopeptidase [Pseudogemmobacter hezensis]
MTIGNENDLEKLRVIGRIVAMTLQKMGAALEPGMTTAELDAIGRECLEREGARSAPQLDYKFPGATCISVNEEAAHGIPSSRRIERGDLVNIDVSAERDGYYSDTGASFIVPPVMPEARRLCEDGERAMWEGIRQVRTGQRFSEIGRAIGSFARKNGYSLIRDLASHGVGRSLHEYPQALATWNNPADKRVMREGMVFTIEPFLSLGAWQTVQGGDGWTLYAMPPAPVVQFEHTVVATRRGPVVLTLPDGAPGMGHLA